ncbi:MAG: hypothetical protein ACKV2U_21745 [Bryobacteraceae bacterium]
MMTPAAPGQVSEFGPALGLFIRETYAPGLHIAFAAGWFLALDGALSVISGGSWNVEAGTAAGILILFVVLFYLRAADEWKDLEYDRTYNPDRPLVRGVVSVRQVTGFMAAAAVVALAVHLTVFGAGPSAAILSLDLGYGLALIPAERASAALRDNIWINLIVTYPVNILLSVYILMLHSERHGTIDPQAGYLMVAAFAMAFLHYEFARKITWPWHAETGRRLYSTSLGTVPAAAFACLFAGGAAGSAAWLQLPRTGPWAWLPAAALLPVAFGVRRLMRVRQQPTTRPVAPLAGPAMQFLVVYYVCMAAVAARTWL